MKVKRREAAGEAKRKGFKNGGSARVVGTKAKKEFRKFLIGAIANSAIGGGALPAPAGVAEKPWPKARAICLLNQEVVCCFLLPEPGPAISSSNKVACILMHIILCLLSYNRVTLLYSAVCERGRPNSRARGASHL